MRHWRDVKRQVAYRVRRTTHPASGHLLTTSEREVDVNLRVNLHGIAVEVVRLVAPLLYSLDCCLGQHGMAAQDMKILHRAIFADHRLQDHRSLNAGLAGEWRILRSHFVNEKALGHTRRDADFLYDRPGQSGRSVPNDLG